MLFAHVAPVLVSLLVGLLIGLVAREFLQVRRHRVGNALMGTQDGFLLGLMVLAAFALGAFLAYFLLSTSF